MRTRELGLTLLACGSLLCLACASDDSDAESVGGTGGSNGGGSAGQAGETSAPRLEVHNYGADDSRIRYVGRIDFSRPESPRFSAPGVHVTLRFEGTSVSVMLKDEFKWGSERNFYDATLDGERVAVISPEQGTTRYEIARGLEHAEHTLTLTKRTESSLGYGIFQGVEVEGELLDPTPENERRIIFIGDSITAGSGAEAPNNSDACSENAWGEAGGWGQPYHNANAAFGPVLARALEADYHVQAVSGIGLVRNYTSEYDTRPMPEVYDLLFMELENSASWDHTNFVPDAVVVGLGTNDFSPGDNDRDPALPLDDYSAAYIDFVDSLLDEYPDAQILCMTSHMLGDGWPSADDQSATNLNTAIDLVVEHYADQGNEQVHKLAVRKVTGRGCGTHLDAEQHSELAEEIRPAVEAALGW